ncbi:uncharacterized protein MYCFIDRAFT_205861 [Pseudocercospora fijiensis CIRAD86]|uniref:Uncharacterized protein n=1 Tax=Pseudocercospora fijiensis (strain CIRAD86) TaxID=383855 RepID=N1Q6H2_PSEFD|nr:uncharacterized protein MYCFIDRAFT_205861 [Pseudocercospora fijiensis CIRAD86]EME87959.1 hypothetical protein MYCFIDRAFT_205861 [Pseudocercospora fijiensis CIRAD86]
MPATQPEPNTEHSWSIAMGDDRLWRRAYITPQPCDYPWLASRCLITGIAMTSMLIPLGRDLVLVRHKTVIMLESLLLAPDPQIIPASSYEEMTPSLQSIQGRTITITYSRSIGHRDQEFLRRCSLRSGYAYLLGASKPMRKPAVDRFMTITTPLPFPNQISSTTNALLKWR